MSHPNINIHNDQPVRLHHQQVQLCVTTTTSTYLLLAFLLNNAELNAALCRLNIR